MLPSNNSNNFYFDSLIKKTTTSSPFSIQSLVNDSQSNNNFQNLQYPKLRLFAAGKNIF